MNQWEAQKKLIEDLLQKANSTIGKFRTAFNEHKKSISENLSSGQRSSSESSFDDGDTQNSYRFLAEESIQKMVEIQNELKTSLSELNVDIGYSSTILGLEPEITSNGIEARKKIH